MTTMMGQARWRHKCDPMQYIKTKKKKTTVILKFHVFFFLFFSPAWRNGIRHTHTHKNKKECRTRVEAQMLKEKEKTVICKLTI